MTRHDLPLLWLLLLALGGCSTSQPMRTVDPGRCIFSEEIRPSRRVEPVYPSKAHSRGSEGWADVEGDIQPSGRLANLVVSDSFPGDLFATATLNALKRWRYTIPEGVPCVHVKVRVSYAMSGGHLREAQAAVETARKHLFACDYEAAILAASKSRANSRNPHTWLESLMIEAASREATSAGSSTPLLSTYVELAPDISTSDNARKRARGYLPPQCGQRWRANEAVR